MHRRIRRIYSKTWKSFGSLEVDKYYLYYLYHSSSEFRKQRQPLWIPVTMNIDDSRNSVIPRGAPPYSTSEMGGMDARLHDKPGKIQDPKLPHLENELWHKIFAATDLETCRANRIAFYDMLCEDLAFGWKFLILKFSGCSVEEWSMMILLLRGGKIPKSLEQQATICNASAALYKLPLLEESSRAGFMYGAYRFITQIAVANNSLQCLKWAHKTGCSCTPWNSDFTKVAAASGFLEVLKFLNEHGCSWDENTTATAMRHGQLPCLKYMIENGCPRAGLLFDEAQKVYRSGKGFGWGHKDCLEYAINNDCPIKGASVYPWTVQDWWCF